MGTALKARARQVLLSTEFRHVLLIISSFLIFDVIVAFLGGLFLSTNTGTFLGKSRTVILSDLLFLEGAVILALGILIAAARAWQEAKQLLKPSSTTNEGTEERRNQKMHPSILMMIVGAILVGLSIIVGTLFS